jgi:protein-disulfide isomerase
VTELAKRHRTQRTDASIGGRGKEAAPGSTGSRDGASNRSPWRSPIIVITIGALALGVAAVAAAAALGRLGSASGPTGSPATGSLVRPSVLSPDALADGRAIGRAAAPATLTLWEDFQCPICGKFTREVEPKLYRDFVDPGLLRIVYRDYAFIGQESFDAAAAARCAGDQGKFWPYHDYLFWNQGPENGGSFARSRLDEIAAAVGLDQAAFDGCMNGSHAMSLVKAESSQAQATGIQETPTLVVDGQVMPGAPLSDLQYAALSNVIKASIARHASPSP